MNEREEIFDHEFLERMRRLFFQLRKFRRLNNKGTQQTRVIGHTKEFKDYRSYSHGDDYRSIDWRLYARLERMFIRVFEEISRAHIHILVDRSASMAVPFSGKRVSALQISVAIAYLSLMNQHSVSVHSFGESLLREIAPLRGQGHIHSIIDQMRNLQFSGMTDFSGSLARFRPEKNCRGMIFIISDFLGSDMEEVTNVLARTSTWASDVHVLHILDPREISPEIEGEWLLRDIETTEEQRINLGKKELERYTREVRDYCEEIRKLCFNRQINYIQWFTGESVEDILFALLGRGNLLAAT